MQDLARLSDAQAEVVANRISGISLDMLKDWHSEAIKSLPEQRVIQQEKLNQRAEANSPATQDGWESLSTFVVVFQGRAMEDGASRQRIEVLHKDGNNSKAQPGEEEEWPGIESEQFWEWMVEQLVALAERKPAVKLLLGETRPVGSSPAAVEPAAIQFTELRIWQPAGSETPRSGTLAPAKLALHLPASQSKLRSENSAPYP